MYENYDLQVNKLVSPNKLPPAYSSQLKKLGLSNAYGTVEPTYHEINPRDINSLTLDHRQFKISKNPGVRF